VQDRRLRGEPSGKLHQPRRALVHKFRQARAHYLPEEWRSLWTMHVVPRCYFSSERRRSRKNQRTDSASLPVHIASSRPIISVAARFATRRTLRRHHDEDDPDGSLDLCSGPQGLCKYGARVGQDEGDFLNLFKSLNMFAASGHSNVCLIDILNTTILLR